MSIQFETWRRNDGWEVHLQRVGGDILWCDDPHWGIFPYHTYQRAKHVLNMRGYNNHPQATVQDYEYTR